MKRLTVIAAGLGWRTVERGLRTAGDSRPYQISGAKTGGSRPCRIAGLTAEAAPSVFPAVTCVAQASLRTGLSPAEHGMISNGWWSETLRKPLFWEQSSALVKGPRVWETKGDAALKGDATFLSREKKIGLFFFQQSLGENVDVLLSPAPIHKHGGGMIMSCYTKPTELAEELRRRCGTFPLWRYWGPLASPKVGRMCLKYFKEMTDLCDLDEAYLYLPTLDYAAQKRGPDSPAARAAFAEFVRQIESLADLCQQRGCELTVTGDYEITPVTAAPVLPNVTLRKAGFFKTRTVGGRAYPDFYQSTAFAMCDHEFCVVYGEAREKAVEALLATGGFERSPSTQPLSHSATQPLSHIILLAKQGSWCGYEWWTDRREAPDFASHVDIHNKPGFDPKELFFFNRGTVKGTHGRACEVAVLR